MMKTKFFKITIISLLIISSLSGCDKKANPQPLLLFRVGTDYNFFILEYNRTYVLYDDGTIKRTWDYAKQDKSKVESYGINSQPNENEAYLYFLDIDKTDGQYLNEIASNIVSLTKETETYTDFRELFIINSKYYYTVWIGDNDDTVCALFEYSITDNTINKIVTYDYEISSLEPYHK